MEETSFDSLTRRAAFAPIGASALMLLTGAAAVRAKKRKKGKKGRAARKGDVNKLCKRQVADCRLILDANCGLGEEQCNEVLDCCDLLKTCNTTQFLTCLFDITND